MYTILVLTPRRKMCLFLDLPGPAGPAGPANFSLKLSRAGWAGWAGCPEAGQFQSGVIKSKNLKFKIFFGNRTQEHQISRK